MTGLQPLKWGTAKKRDSDYPPHDSGGTIMRWQNWREIVENESYWLGETLRLARQTKLSNKALADKAGVGYHWLTKVRQGVIKNPGIVSIERVYSVLVEYEEAAARAA